MLVHLDAMLFSSFIIRLVVLCWGLFLHYEHLLPSCIWFRGTMLANTEDVWHGRSVTLLFRHVLDNLFFFILFFISTGITSLHCQITCFLGLSHYLTSSFFISPQIPTSFRYGHGNELDQRRGRGHTFHRNFSENQLSMAIESSLETANAERMFHGPPTSNSVQVDVDRGNAYIDSVIQPFESLDTAGSESSSKYRQPLGQNSRSAPLEDSSFPPLPIASSNSQQKPKHGLVASSSNTVAAHLRRHRNVSVINSAYAWPAAARGTMQQSSSNPAQSRLTTNIAPGISHNSGLTKTVVNNGPAPSTYASSVQATHRTAHGHLSPRASRDKHDNGRIVHSASAPNEIGSSPVEPSLSDFPPVSAAQMSKLPTSGQSSLNTEDVHTANKSLVEKIRSGLDFDEDRYTIFKDISGQYRQGKIGTGTFLDYVQQFGLSHLVLELARLCPDAWKQKELVESYNASFQRNSNDLQENGPSSTSTPQKQGKVSRKDNGKSVGAVESKSKERVADSFLNTVRQLQLNNSVSEEKLEVLSRGDYRSNKGKSKIEQQIDTNNGNQPRTKHSGQSETSGGSLSNQNRENGGGRSKQRKKTSKFLRVRLGDGSAEAFLDGKNSHADPDPGTTDDLEGNKDDLGGLPVRGVWRNRGGKKLFS